MSLLLLTAVLTACNTTKFVPEGQYLLNKTRVRVLDTKEVTSGDLDKYLRQKQNTEILGFWKLQLDIYNTAPMDTTTKSRKMLAENAKKMGEAPILYDESLTRVSMDQLVKAMQNRGYFHARVDTSLEYKPKKVDLTYNVTAGDVYTIRHYLTSLDHEELYDIANRRSSLIKSGMIFNSDLMDEERQRITSGMRRRGYYYFEKSMLCYEADSSRGHNEVDLEMKVQPYIEALPDSVRDKLYRQYYISRVHFYMDHDPRRVEAGLQLHTELKGRYTYTYAGKRLLRNQVLRHNCKIEPGMRYNELLVEQTYANLNSLGPVKYVDIRFEQVAPDSLECHVTLSRGKMNTVSAEVEGTYSAGDWGIALAAGYINKNIFRGAEQLSLRGRGSYEWRQTGGRAIEGTAEAGLQFPNNLKINIAYNYQNRPDEYSRTIANAGLYYTLHKNRSRWTHTFNLIDISYIYLPSVSEEFQHKFIDHSSVLKTSYEDHFILDWSYRGSYSSFRASQPYRSYVSFSYALETAGNLLYAISRVAKLELNDQMQYVIFKIPYSQYAKADVNFTFHQIFHPSHRLVYHAGLGVAVPYLNASVIPFEKRYFSGGSNSVRGWQARTLGPGGFRGNGSEPVYDLQTGDIRLDLNLEYRWRVWRWIELAAFLDAGNIWTINEYDSQPNGVFDWTEFYRQIAMSYGVGLRLDFDFFVFRIDFGVKLHDPSRLYGSYAGTAWRTVPNGLNWRDDMTFHFAIGYPF